jgi:hypothetical protein
LFAIFSRYGGFIDVHFLLQSKHRVHYIVYDFCVKWYALPLHWVHFASLYALLLLHVVVVQEFTRNFRQWKWQTSVELHKLLS